MVCVGDLGVYGWSRIGGGMSSLMGVHVQLIENACCHIARRGLSGVGFSGKVTCSKGSVMMFWAGA